MGNPCGTVHMPNFPCRECDRLRAKQAKIDSIPRLIPDEVERLKVDPETIETRVKEARLDAARGALSAAQRQKRFREKDPEAYRKWNRARMKAHRAKIRGSPSSEE